MLRKKVFVLWIRERYRVWAEVREDGTFKISYDTGIDFERTYEEVDKIKESFIKYVEDNSILKYKKRRSRTKKK